MKLRVADASRRSAWMSSLPRLLVSGVAVFALSASAAATPHHKAASAKKIQVAELVPLPRLKPGRALADPIGVIIASGEDNPAAPISEDDAGPIAPPAVSAPVFAPVPPDQKAAATGPHLGAVGLRLALKLLDDGDPAAATLAAYALPDRVDTKIVDWLVAISGRPDVPSSHIAEVAAKLSDWPGQTLLRLRFEQALAREKPTPDQVVKALGGTPPVTDDGTLLLARSLIALGRKGDAAALMRPYWRHGNLPDDVESTVRKEFGSLFTVADNKARMDRLLYKEQMPQALRVASLLDKNQRGLADASIAVIKRKPKAGALLDALPAAIRSDPLYLYSRIQYLRHADRIAEAATLMLAAPRDPKVLGSPDAWWVERRLIARALLDRGDPRTAYRIAAGYAAESTTLRAEAEFHAGWIALEYLRDPATAMPHFKAIQSISTMPLSQSRAEYWLGRAAAAAGNTAEATIQFRRAAAYPTAFYGQLALARLGVTHLTLSAPPPPDAALRQRFEAREFVQVIERLSEANHDDRVDIFYRALADLISDPSEIALLAGMAEANGEHQIALQVGKIAASRGLPVETLAFPTTAIPPSLKTTSIESPVVYAIARQESAFNPAAVSSAGARGLLQLMPATANHVASAVGLPFSQARLTSDPGYNATLGAAHLGELFNDFGGSYVMTFASYNAGKSRVYDWIKAHGDPRDPKVDVVDWIELIPFTETRNYVQRTMENLQVYRARLGGGGLGIDADLKRGVIN
jgi:soluble lytic murein transglycosylase